MRHAATRGTHSIEDNSFGDTGVDAIVSVLPKLTLLMDVSYGVHSSARARGCSRLLTHRYASGP